MNNSFRKRIAVLFGIMSLILIPVRAQEFFDTSVSERLFNVGVRAGFNTSNRTFPKGAFNTYTHDSWGLGLNAGVVANLNFREYLSLQPGIFFESRSGDFSYFTDYLSSFGKNETSYQIGHLRTYSVSVPIMGIVKFNLSPDIKWNVEFGPYFQYIGKETGQNKVAVLYRPAQSNDYLYYIAKQRSFDVGLKIGSGLLIKDHYYLGIHYLAGLCNAWSMPSGGRNKSWSFTIGYDF